MTRADRVHSTPPLNTSAITPTSRRGFLAQAAGVAAGSAVLIGAPTFAAPTIASHGVVDPILAAIDAHKAAYRAVLPQIDIQNELESELMQLNRRGSGEVVWEDPRWIACEQAIGTLWGAEGEAAANLVCVVPTRAAGLIALLQYAISADIDGETWPRDLTLLDDDGKEVSASWHRFLIENVAEALPSMVGSAI